jgi:hypothetical protein
MRTLHRALWGLLAATPVIIAPIDARAEPPSQSSEAAATKAASARRWYGWQTLIVAGGSSLLLGATAIFSATNTNSSLSNVSFGGFLASFSGFAVGGPIVHWAHRNVGKGFASLGINVGAIGIGAGVGFVAAGGHEGPSDIAAGLGAGLGALTGLILDVSLLTYDPLPPAGNTSSVQHRRPPLLLPALDIRKDRASLGLIGTF